MKPEVAASGIRRRAWVALLALASLASPAFLAAQEARGVLASLAAYEGADRHQRLLEGARREGFLSLYTSFPPEDVATLNAAFEKKYGVKVRAWRAASEKVLQRTVAEARAGRDEVDLVDSNSVPLELLRRQGLLQAVRSAHHADLIPAAVPEHREWAWARLSVFVQAYNTRLIRQADLPASYGDLLDPRWKGKLGIEASDEDWFAEVVRNLGEEKGLKLFRDLAAKNGLSVRRGHSLLAQMVASGEVPFALTVYNFTADQLKGQGAPLEWFTLSPAIAHGNGFAVIRRAPHPHAALLYYEFMIGDDGQRILADRKSVPTSKKIRTVLDRGALKIIDPVLLVDQGERWAKLYEEIIVKGSR
ncbi:MAG: extracellular solute-binding protein [Betaproteobacteria bacterium]|nr:MAG: extracellular solute-binding protein [Betaproteobacteria bacterium]